MSDDIAAYDSAGEPLRWLPERPKVYCPGCGKEAPAGTYPDGYEGPWWCNDCLLNKIKRSYLAKYKLNKQEA